jgi:general L-amino acid transport system substrate-binding protein
MAPAESSVQHLSDLAGQSICFSILQPAQYHLDRWFAERHLDYIRTGFQEDGEMNDGYTVRYCKALAGEITTLADTRATAKGALSKDRFLPETLAAYPIVAATPVKDGEWASIVAWTIQTLIAAEAQETKYSVGGIKTLPIEAPELGLAPDWQQRLVGLVGTYRDLYDRNLGDKSELKIPRGLNASIVDGGALDVLHAE